jgi:hypothetical protein
VRILRAGDFFCAEGGAMSELVYQNDEAIREVVEKFEHCEYAPQEFTHARHLTVACWYLCTLAPDEALIRMRSRLQNFTAYHGKHGYHETITRFWMKLIENFLHQQPQDLGLAKRVNAVVQGHPKETLFDYSTRDRVLSDTAKQEWVDPDVRPIGDRLTN